MHSYVMCTLVWDRKCKYGNAPSRLVRKSGALNNFFTVAMMDVRSNSELKAGFSFSSGSLMTRPFGMCGEMRSVGIRIPRRVNSKPYLLCFDRTSVRPIEKKK